MIKVAGLAIAWFALWLGIAGTFRPEPTELKMDCTDHGGYVHCSPATQRPPGEVAMVEESRK